MIICKSPAWCCRSADQQGMCCSTDLYSLCCCALCRPVATRGSLVYFLIDTLNALDRVYHYSMANFVYILRKGEAAGMLCLTCSAVPASISRLTWLARILHQVGAKRAERISQTTAAQLLPVLLYILHMAWVLIHAQSEHTPC